MLKKTMESIKATQSTEMAELTNSLRESMRSISATQIDKAIHNYSQATIVLNNLFAIPFSTREKLFRYAVKMSKSVDSPIDFPLDNLPDNPEEENKFVQKILELFPVIPYNLSLGMVITIFGMILSLLSFAYDYIWHQEQSAYEQKVYSQNERRNQLLESIDHKLDKSSIFDSSEPFDKQPSKK